ncbi:unnamed protein product, partial [Durusdinium trenchii]
AAQIQESKEESIEELEEKTPAPAENEQFTVKISKVGGKLGGALDTVYETHCVVRHVDAGGALAGQNIQKYDRLRQVQQKEGSASALVKMIAGASDELELLIERPTMKDLVLHKNGDKVGLKIDKDSDTLGLIIKEVIGGAAAQLPVGTFKPMDRIVAVEGQEGNAKMFELITSVPSPSIRVCSYGV